MIVASADAELASIVPGVSIFPAAHLEEVIADDVEIEVASPHRYARPKVYDISMRDVRGQEEAISEVRGAVDDGRPVLLVGQAGAGKTMIARRIPTIMPAPTDEELLEINVVASVAGIARAPIAQRPFRAPHYTASEVGMLGGGAPPRPGEISLAHRSRCP